MYNWISICIIIILYSTMSSIVYLRNRKSNVIYAYLNEYVWDDVK